MKLRLLFTILPSVLWACVSTAAPPQAPEELPATALHGAHPAGNTVITVATGLGGDHVLRKGGHLLLSTGPTITRTTLRGTDPEVIATGFAYAACKVLDRHGNLIVVDFGSNQVIKQQPNGVQSVLASGLLGPVGCALDTRQRLYVAEAGIGNTPGTRILRTNEQGVLTPWVNLAGSAAPLIALSGLAVDDKDRIYVANYVDGRIARIKPDGTVSLFADVGIQPAFGAFALSYLAFADDDLYATHLSGNRVYRITKAGASSVAAGTGVAGSTDGPALSATFNLPNGIAATPGERALYVTEAGSGSLRLFVLPR
jgi:sugar lactone lactonase YvrE